MRNIENNTAIVVTNSSEQHVVQQKSNGHNDEDKFPGLPGRVEICPDIGAGHILCSLGTHPDIHSYSQLDKGWQTLHI